MYKPLTASRKINQREQKINTFKKNKVMASLLEKNVSSSSHTNQKGPFKKTACSITYLHNAIGQISLFYPSEGDDYVDGDDTGRIMFFFKNRAAA